MSEVRKIKEAIYADAFESIRALVPPLVQTVDDNNPKHEKSTNTNIVAALSNVSSILFYALNQAAYKVLELRQQQAGDVDEPQWQPTTPNPLEKVPVNWCGFYLFYNNNWKVLELGPFQGKIACVRIKVGRGVCGTAVKSEQTQVVPDVHAVPGHIACDDTSQSEIVVNLRSKLADGDKRVVGVLDIDSTVKNFFSFESGSEGEGDNFSVDQFYLEQICDYVGEALTGKFEEVFHPKPSIAAEPEGKAQ